jgi:hypothetical protein
MNVSKCALVLAIACIVGGCSAAGAVKGSGTIKTEPREVNGFTGVELAGSAKLIVQQGETEGLTITADDNLLEHLTADVQSSKLILGTKGRVPLEPTAPITYTLSVKRLNTIGVSGDVSVDARDIHTDSLTVAVSGSANISISGEAEAQKIAISGTADYKADSFKTKDTSISISGSGKALIAASNRLDAEVSGSGDVQYIGNPDVTKNITGSGIVKAWAQ